jgi:AcrR family transcriptional regulator
LHVWRFGKLERNACGNQNAPPGSRFVRLRPLPCHLRPGQGAQNAARYVNLRSTQNACTLHVMEDGDCLGLRERKKLATREALSEAAIRLALQHDLEHVRVADIAAEAGVSPRTFNNYFSSVPEAICALTAERAMTLGELVRRRPRSEQLAEAVTNALVEVHSSPEYRKELVRLILVNPLVRAEFFKTIIARDNALAGAIAERVGSPPCDLFPHVLAAAYSSATRVVTHRWLHDDSVDFLAVLREAVGLIAPMAAAREGNGNRNRDSNGNQAGYAA